MMERTCTVQYKIVPYSSYAEMHFFADEQKKLKRTSNDGVELPGTIRVGRFVQDK